METEGRRTIPKSDRLLCGAKTRSGAPCKAKVVSGRNRCRMHGSGSTGPKTQEGKDRIREANRKRALERARQRVLTMSADALEAAIRRQLAGGTRREAMQAAEAVMRQAKGRQRREHTAS